MSDAEWLAEIRAAYAPPGASSTFLLRLYDAQVERNAALVAELRRGNIDTDFDDGVPRCDYCHCEVDADGNARPGNKHTGEFCAGEEE